MISYKYSCIIPKSSKFIPFLKELAFDYDIKLDLDYEETGIIFKKQHIKFKLSSENEENINKCIKTLDESIESFKDYYNL
ncbi:MAG: hypothetical protein M0R17_03080 [Candidatus Omnitrophica bacterium]|jgi:hypothetical protein|nr:hypothetical protein [Candidatus Omnitrophota bacterium]